MLKTLVRKEVLNNLLNLRFVVVYFLAVCLLMGSMTVMLSQYVTDKAAYDISTAINARMLHGHANESYDDYLWADKTVERPVLLTRIFAQGGEKDADPRARAAPEFSPYFQGEFKRNPITNLFPSFDMVFVIGIVFSLLIFLLTYDCVSGEREEGTLKVLLSCAVPRDTILLAKWLGGFISIVIPIVASMIAIVLMLLLEGRVSANLDTWMRIGAIFGVCLLYVATVFSLSMALSVVMRDSGTTVLMLLLFWALVIVAVPSLSTPAAYLAVSPPGPYHTEVAMGRVGIANYNQTHRTAEKWWIEHFGKVEFEQLTEAQKAFIHASWRERTIGMMDHVAGIADSMVVFGTNDSRTHMAVERAARWLSRVSPFGCLENACVALAGTGAEHEVELREAMGTYDRAAIAFVVDYLKTCQTGNGLDPYQAPVFAVPRTTVAGAMGDAGLDIGLLALMTIGFFMAAYLVFLRSDIA